MAENPKMLWYSVSAPGCWCEYELPDQEVWRTRRQHEQYERLKTLAAAHGVSIRSRSERQGPPMPENA